MTILSAHTGNSERQNTEVFIATLVGWPAWLVFACVVIGPTLVTECIDTMKTDWKNQ